MSAFIPVLLKPRLQSMRNSFVLRSDLQQYWARNIFIFLMTLAIMYAVYRGSLWTLAECETQLDFAYLHPSVILGLFFFILTIVLIITNVATAAGALYLGNDLEFILASPLPPFRFFLGKLLEIVVSSSWMTAIFLIPIAASFAKHYHAHLSYLVVCCAAFIPFFLIPAGIAIVAATLLALFVPTKWRRELLVIFCGLGLVGLYSLARLVTFGFDDGKPIDTRDLFRIIGLFSIANTTWSPAYWVAASLGEVLAPKGTAVAWYLGLLYSLVFFLLSLGFLLIRFFHFAAYSRAALHARSKSIDSVASQQRILKIFGSMRPAIRALVVKELKTSSRDVVQAMQVILICVLCVLYLYVLSFQGLFQRIIPEAQRGWWKVFLITCNLCMEAFVVTAIANRLVFPSVSREGRSFWSLQTAPISLREILKVKYFLWLVVVGVFTSIVFGGAALLLSRSLTVVCVKILLNLATSIGVLGLAIGLGAYFADFEWDHPAQLITGFGNMVYTVVAVMLIGINLLFGAGLLFLAFTKGFVEIISEGKPLLASLGGFVFIFLANILIARWALALGERSLERRR